MARKKNYKPLIALAALAVAALAMATLTFTNVTWWIINATLPPAMKYGGEDSWLWGRDDGSGYEHYTFVNWYFDPDTGYNVTIISLVGFTGDPTNYTDIIRLCNKYYNGPLYVKLVAVGTVGNTGYESYVRDFRVYFYQDGYGNTYGYSASGYYIQFEGSSISVGSTDTVPIPKDTCAKVGAYVLVDPNLPPSARDGRTMIAQYQVNVVFSNQP